MKNITSAAAIKKKMSQAEEGKVVQEWLLPLKGRKGLLILLLTFFAFTVILCWIILTSPRVINFLLYLLLSSSFFFPVVTVSRS